MTLLDFTNDVLNSHKHTKYPSEDQKNAGCGIFDPN